MHHVYRSSDLYDITVKLNSITDNVQAETMIQDIRGIGNVNSIMTLTIADDKKRAIYILPLFLETCELGVEFF
jgi:hypothetical protein